MRRGLLEFLVEKNALEITGVHPESYSVAENLLNKLGYKKRGFIK